MPRLAWIRSAIDTSCVTGMTGVYHHAQLLLVEMGVSWTFCSDCPWTMVLLIATSQAVCNWFFKQHLVYLFIRSEFFDLMEGVWAEKRCDSDLQTFKTLLGESNMRLVLFWSQRTNLGKVSESTETRVVLGKGRIVWCLGLFEKGIWKGITADL
jgi:hypothetical protein